MDLQRRQVEGKRIGFDVTAALSQGGGIGRYTRELVHAVVDMDRGNTYRLFSARPPGRLLVADPLPSASNAEHRPAPLNERWLYRLWYRARLRVPVQVVTGPLDLFHSPDFVLPPIAGGIPTILTVHDLSFTHFPEVFPPPLVSFLNRAVPESIRRASLVLADSQATAADLRSVWSVPVDKIHVLYSGVNERFKRVADQTAFAALRARYGLGERPFLLAVGTLQPRKNYEMLIRAFGRVSDQLDHNLVISGGPGWLFETISQQIARLDLGQRVVLTGFVDDHDLPALYSAADVFVFPSLYEGFGLPILEAMACGVPVISSRASSLPEVTGTGAEQAAVLLSPTDEVAWADAMLGLIQDRPAREKLVGAGTRRVRLFTWSRAAAELLGLYSRML